MSIAYTIQGAAEAACVAQLVIIAAVKGNHLIARRIESDAAIDKVIILHTDLQAWAEKLPDFRATL
jgi:hypothetical protein